MYVYAKKLESVKVLLFVLTILFVPAFAIYNQNINTPPAYQYHETTWLGNPAFSKLHENGDYSFYASVPRFRGMPYVGQHIITMPASDAVHFHY
jgi:hypothetical protein